MIKIKKIRKLPVLLIIIGLIELLISLDIFKFGFFEYWPVILIIIGFVMIWNSFLDN